MDQKVYSADFSLWHIDVNVDNDALQLDIKGLTEGLFSKKIKTEKLEVLLEIEEDLQREAFKFSKSGHEESRALNWALNCEFRYFGNTNLDDVWDGPSEIKHLKYMCLTSYEGPFSHLFRLEIQQISLKKVNGTCVRIGLRSLKIEVTVTSKSSRHVLPIQLMPKESLQVVLPSSQTGKEFSCLSARAPNKFPEEEDASRNKINVETPECTIKEGVETQDKVVTLEREGEDLSTLIEAVEKQDKVAMLKKEGEDFSTLKDGVEKQDKVATLEKEWEDLNTVKEGVEKQDKVATVGKEGEDLNTLKEGVEKQDKVATLGKERENLSTLKDGVETQDKVATLEKEGEDLSTLKERVEKQDKVATLEKEGENLSTLKDGVETQDKVATLEKEGEDLSTLKERVEKQDKVATLEKEGENLSTLKDGVETQVKDTTLEKEEEDLNTLKEGAEKQDKVATVGKEGEDLNTLKDGVETQVKDTTLEKEEVDLNTLKKRVEKQDKVTTVEKEGEDFNTLKEGIETQDNDATLEKEGEDLNTLKDGVGTQDKDATLPCLRKKGVDLNKEKKADKDLFWKKEKNGNTNRIEYGAAKLDEDFAFHHQRSCRSLPLQCIEALGKVIFACSSVLFSNLPVLALLLLIPSSNGLSTEKPKMESCVPEAAVPVGNIFPLDSCETCDSHKFNVQCQGKNIFVCLKIYGTSQFAVGCAPNICINNGCPEWNGENGSYKVQYRYMYEDCNSSCPEHFSLVDWKNCTASPPPSVGTNCSNGSDSGAIYIVIGLVVAAVVVVVGVVLWICWRRRLYCFGRNRTDGEGNSMEMTKMKV